MATKLAEEIRPRDLARFLSRIVFEANGCWRWTGTVRNRQLGYGGFSLRGRQEQAHRVSYRLIVGEIAHGLHLDHLCRNPWCINPSHLEPVTCRVNTLRGVGPPAINAVKTHCVHGHPLSGHNLLINSRGHRVCRTCNREIQRRFYLRKKAA
jgi:hypothetical protein